MKEISDRNPKDELHDIDSSEINKIDNSEIDLLQDDSNTNETILCEECEYSLIVGLKSKCNDLNYCLDCAIQKALVKAMITNKNMVNKSKGRDEK